MKLALVYDYINQYGGGERLLAELLEIFKEADLYTIFYDSKVSRQIPPQRVTKTSWLDFGLARRHHHYFIPLMPKAAESLDLSDRYDVILSVGAGYAKGISYSRGRHIHYCFTPLRYATSPDYYLEKRFGRSVYGLVKPILKPLVKYLKEWDYRSGQKPDEIITLSNYIKNKIKETYGRSASIIYPPVNRDIFYPAPGPEKDSYYLAAGRLLHYKGFELIIEAFNKLQQPLFIVGRGPKLKKLIALNTSPKTKFITYHLPDETMRFIYSNARALLFPQIEDFGLVAAEAIACGTPVIGYYQGGSKDIIEPEVNGLLIHKQTPEALLQAIDRLGDYQWQASVIAATAQKFSRQEFARQIKQVVEETK